MSYAIRFSVKAEKVIIKYKKSNPVFYRKLSQLLTEITEHPRSGTGHPEPLVAGNSQRYSRRLSANDKIIYDIYDDIVVVYIVSVGGHYDDK